MKQYIETSAGDKIEGSSVLFTGQAYQFRVSGGYGNCPVAYNADLSGYFVTGTKWPYSGRGEYIEDCYTGDSLPSYTVTTNGSYRRGGPFSGKGIFNDACQLNTFVINTYYTISVSSNNTSYGTVTGGGSEILSGSSTTIKATAKSGYKFVQWSDGSTSASRTITNITSDASYTAQFAGNHTFTVKFNANGGTGTMSNQAFVKETPQALAKNEFKRAGYIFKSWNTKADGTGTTIADGADGTSLYTTLNATVNLYAQWRTPNLNVTKVDVDGASVTGAGTVVLLDMDGTVLATDESGSISYECTAGKMYILKSRDVNKLWSAKGVKSTSGNTYESEYSFVFPANTTSYSLTYYFSRNRTYRIVVGSGMSSLLSIETPCDETDSSGNKLWLPQTINVKVTPQAGKMLSSYNILDMDTKGSLSTGIASGTSFSFAFSQESLGNRSGLEVYAGFDDIKYYVRVYVDDKSSIGGSVKVSSTGTASISDVTYGTSVTIVATPSSSAYSFDAWYSTTGSVVSRSSTYTVSVDENKVYYAKFAVNVNLHSGSITYQDNRTGGGEYLRSCSISPDTGTTGTNVVLGDSLDYSISLGSVVDGGSSWNFDGWYSSSDCSAGSITEYDSSGKITPTAPVSIYAKVVSVVKVRNVSVYMVDRENKTIISKTSVTDGSISASLSATTSGRRPQDVPLYVPWEFSFTGTRYIELNATSSADWGTGTDKSFSFYSTEAPGETGPSEESIVSRDSMYTFLLNKDNVVLYAYYGKAQRVRTTLAYGVGDRSMGSMRIVSATNDESAQDPEEAEISEDRLSVVTEQGQEFTVEVSVNNGYVFRGFYRTRVPSGEPLYDGMSFTGDVTTERTLYAWFEKDTNAVCEWEGSNVNKMMTWRSKVYVSPRPFNASSIRIDALNDDEGRNPPSYKPVVQSLSVEMFSAPDSTPTATATLYNVDSQTVRRLPIRRMEKYMQLCVENDREILEIVVGTSAGGLAV